MESRGYTWIESSIEKKTGDDWSVSMESELRYSFDDEVTTERILKLGGHYQVVNDHKLGLIYQFDVDFGREENRFILQSNLSLFRSAASSLSQRVRLEGRYFRNPTASQSRLRYRIQFKKKMFDRIKMPISNELFFAIYDSENEGSPLVIRNRFKLGLEFNFEFFDWGLAYVNQYNFGPDRVENVIASSFSF